MNNPDTETHTQPVSTVAHSKPKPSAAMIAMVVFAALLAIIMGFFWQQLQVQNEQLDAFRQQIEADQRAQNRLLEQTRTAEEALETLMKEQLALFEARLEKLSGADRSDWLLGEAEYLLRLAHHYAVLAKDTKAAEMLLVNADDVMKEYERQHVVNPAVIEIRRLIAHELAQLRLYNEFDEEGLYLQLEGLIHTLDAIKVVDIQNLSAQPADTAEQVPEQTSTSQTNPVWQSFQRMIEKAGLYIRIREHNNETGPLLSPDEQRYIKQNLRFRLEQAQLAVLQQHQAVYKSSLSDAKNWVQQYYVMDSQSKKKLIGQMDELLRHNVERPVPDMDASLEALKRYMQKRQSPRRK